MRPERLPRGAPKHIAHVQQDLAKGIYVRFFWVCCYGMPLGGLRHLLRGVDDVGENKAQSVIVG